MRKDSTDMIQMTVSEQDDARSQRIAIIGGGAQVQHNGISLLVVENDAGTDACFGPARLDSKRWRHLEVSIGGVCEIVRRVNGRCSLPDIFTDSISVDVCFRVDFSVLPKISIK